MPKRFIKTGYGLTDIVLGATEFKFQIAYNFELNLTCLMFSKFKKYTVIRKALIGISTHGMGLLFSDIYAASISDSEITEMLGVINYVEQRHEIMSDRGFSIQELCTVKGITLNWPKHEENEQFDQSDLAANFDIAATKIHVERFIDRIGQF